MNWLRNFMMGRYGGDQLSIGLIAFSFVIGLVAQFTGLWMLTLVSYLPLGWTIFRMFSRNISKRRAENAVFLKWWTPIQNWFVQKWKQIKDSKTHKYFHCPNCKVLVRVPRHRGKICITCPKCKTEFIKKT